MIQTTSRAVLQDFLTCDSFHPELSAFWTWAINVLLSGARDYCTGLCQGDLNGDCFERSMSVVGKSLFESSETAANVVSDVIHATNSRCGHDEPYAPGDVNAEVNAFTGTFCR